MKRKTILIIGTMGLLAFMVSCGGGEEPVHGTSNEYEKTGQVTTEKEAPVAVEQEPASLEERLANGKVLYKKVCQVCHQADGKGLPGAFPPVAQSDYLDADHARAIAGVVNGLEGEITVNGEKYNSVMPKTDMTDAEIADVFTYVLSSFGNKGGEVSATDVAATRK